MHAWMNYMDAYVWIYLVAQENMGISTIKNFAILHYTSSSSTWILRILLSSAPPVV